MAFLQAVRGTTARAVNIFIQDSANPGKGLAGLTFNSVGLICYYIVDNAVASNAVSLQSMTIGTWISGGFIEVDSTHMAGVYQFGIPNAALASGTSVTVVFSGATGMLPYVLDVELTGVNQQSATAFITGVNSLAPPTNWNLQSIDGSGRMDVAKITGVAQTGRDIGASVLLSSGTGTGQVSLSSGAVKIQTSVTTNTQLANFMFVMTDTSGTPTAGYTVTATRSIDGAAFGACANAVSAVGNGVYKITLAAADVNGTVIALRFTASGARDTDIILITTP